MDKANAAGGVWASPKWAVAAYGVIIHTYAICYVLFPMSYVWLCLHEHLDGSGLLGCRDRKKSDANSGGDEGEDASV